MTQNHQPYITLDSIITDFLNESEQSNAKYAKLFHLAFRGFEILGLDFFYAIKSVKIPVNDNLTVNLPPDYLNWTKVGILNNNGGIIPLYYNQNLTTYADLLSERIEKTTDPESSWLENDWGLNTWCNYWDGFGYTNIYGVPSGEPFVGSFKVDTVNGVIILNDSFNRDYIMLEYVSTPIETEEYYLPMQFREAMIAWLWWRDTKAKTIRSHMQVGTNRDLKHDFYNERRLAIARWKPSRDSEKYQASQEQSRLAVKT